MIRVVVAEDSPTARELLVKILESDPELTVVGTARDGRQALEMTRELAPDAVTMDIRMPIMDGLEATRRIMSEQPTPIVVIAAIDDAREVEVSMGALEAGAIAVLPKEAGPGSPAFEVYRRRVITTVKSMSEVKVVRRRAPVADRAPAAKPRTSRAIDLDRPGWRSPPRRRSPIRIAAIGVSTGGPSALHQILASLPADYRLPLVVVQHITPGFTPGLASWLNAGSPATVKVAENGEPLLPGVVYIAAEGHHLGVRDRHTVMLSEEDPIDGFRPSASHLFRSVARSFGSSAVALILTGMGVDGLAGLRELRAAGGHVIAQSEASSVVFGMPKAAIDARLADDILDLESIATRLRELAETT